MLHYERLLLIVKNGFWCRFAHSTFALVFWIYIARSFTVAIWSRFLKDCAQSLFVIGQSKAVLPGKLLDLCLAVFFSYRPDALQFLLVDSAVPQIVTLELQLTPDKPGENFHEGYLAFVYLGYPQLGCQPDQV